MEFEFDVFLSFNSRDRELAKTVYDFLTVNNYKVFFSDETLAGKPNFVSEINHALKNTCDFLLVTSSPDHFIDKTPTNPYGSNWVSSEIEKFTIVNNNRTAKGLPKGKWLAIITSINMLEQLPLEIQADSAVTVFSETDTFWDTLLQYLPAAQKRVPYSDDCFSSEMMSKTTERLDELRMFYVSASSDVFLRTNQVYVALPIDEKLSILVNNQRVEKIANNNQFDFRDISESQYSSMEDGIDHLLYEGIEYQYPLPEERPKILSPVWESGIKKDFWILNAIDFISINNKTVVIGDPGLGKSTLLSVLAIRLCNQYNSSHNHFSDLCLSDVFYKNRFFSVFIELGDMISFIDVQQVDSITHRGLKIIARYICKKLMPEKYYTYEENVCEFLTRRCVFILDGLDEIHCSERNKNLINIIINDIERYSPESKIVFSCRERDYPFWELGGFAEAQLQLMDRSIMLRLLNNLFSAFNSNADPTALISEINRMQLDDRIVGNPLLLSLIANLFVRGRGNSLTSKSMIIKDSIALLLERKCENLKDMLNCETDMIMEALEEIAFKIQTHQTLMNKRLNEMVISRASLIAIIGNHMQDTAPRVSIEFLKATAGVIALQETRKSDNGEDEFEFTHRHFQEFLCAVYLRKTKIKDAIQIIQKGLSEDPIRWSETCLLYVEAIHDVSDEERTDRIWKAIKLLLGGKRDSTFTKLNRCWFTWLAARTISYNNYEILPEFDDDYDDDNDEILEKFRSMSDIVIGEEDFPISHKVEYLYVLGVIGDNRNGVGLNEGIPDHLFIEMNPSKETFTMGATEDIQQIIRNQGEGNNRWGISTTFSREIPPKPIILDDFYISKYETTCEQFIAFLDADDGYTSSRWWQWSKISYNWFSENVNESRRNNIKRESLKHRNAPITKVCFYEAVAYCLWLSTKTIDGSIIRMPTEGEWEFAARQHGGVFSWGNTFDKKKCNCSYTGIGDIVPVGLFDQCDLETPVEMNGNAWEWCQSVFPSWKDVDEETMNSYDEIGNYVDTNALKNLECEMRVAVRGGSFVNPPPLLRSTFRGRDRMSASFYRQGFRVVKEKVPHKSNIPSAIKSNLGKDMNAKQGAGTKIEIGDKIRIVYKAELNGEVIEDRRSAESAIEVTIGEGKLNNQLENYLLSTQASIATTFDISLTFIKSLSDLSPKQYRITGFIQERQ